MKLIIDNDLLSTNLDDLDPKDLLQYYNVFSDRIKKETIFLKEILDKFGKEL